MSQISREVFDALWVECSHILAHYCFRIPKIDTPPPVLLAFESCFEMVGEVWAKAPTPKIPIPECVTAETIDTITLELAYLAARQGIKGFRYNECLNSLRSGVIKVIEEMGYEKPPGTGPAQRWVLYKRWEDVARESGVREKEILETRENRYGRR